VSIENSSSSYVFCKQNIFLLENFFALSLHGFRDVAKKHTISTNFQFTAAFLWWNLGLTPFAVDKYTLVSIQILRGKGT